MYEEVEEPLYVPPTLLRRMVVAGRPGRKSGGGSTTTPLDAESLLVPGERAFTFAG